MCFEASLGCLSAVLGLCRCVDPAVLSGEGCPPPGMCLAGLTRVGISLSSHAWMLSKEKVFSGTCSPQPDRKGCFLQLLGNTSQCTLTNTTAGINCLQGCCPKSLHCEL